MSLGDLWLQEWRTHTPTTTDIKNLYEALHRQLREWGEKIMAALDDLKAEQAKTKDLISAAQREAQQIADNQAAKLAQIADLVAQLAAQNPELEGMVAEARDSNAKFQAVLKSLDVVSGTQDIPDDVPPEAARRNR